MVGTGASVGGLKKECAGNSDRCLGIYSIPLPLPWKEVTHTKYIIRVSKSWRDPWPLSPRPFTTPYPSTDTHDL